MERIYYRRPYAIKTYNFDSLVFGHTEGAWRRREVEVVSDQPDGVGLSPLAVLPAPPVQPERASMPGASLEVWREKAAAAAGGVLRPLQARERICSKIRGSFTPAAGGLPGTGRTVGNVLLASIGITSLSAATSLPLRTVGVMSEAVVADLLGVVGLLPLVQPPEDPG